MPDVEIRLSDLAGTIQARVIHPATKTDMPILIPGVWLLHGDEIVLQLSKGAYDQLVQGLQGAVKP